MGLLRICSLSVDGSLNDFILDWPASLADAQQLCIALQHLSNALATECTCCFPVALPLVANAKAVIAWQGRCSCERFACLLHPNV